MMKIPKHTKVCYKKMFRKPQRLKKVPAVVIIPEFLSKKLCLDIIRSVKFNPDSVIKESAQMDHLKNYFLDQDKTFELHNYIFNKVLAVNKKYYGFDDLFLSERHPLHISEYKRGEFRDFHYDGGIDDPTNSSYVDKEDERLYHNRAITCVIQLSDPIGYTGGDLKFMRYLDPVNNPHRKEQGTALIFPSSQWHEVTKVKQGVRHSLCLFLYSDGKKLIR